MVFRVWLINEEFYLKFLLLKNNREVEVEKCTEQLSSFTDIDE